MKPPKVFADILKFKKHLLTTPSLSKKFIHKLNVIYHAVSLGATESLICIPYLTTMLYLPEELRTKFGVKLNTVRLSAGIENTQSLLDDLEQALK